MTDLSVRQVQGAGALSAEHYQTFEMAKANDTIIGGDDIAQIRSYAAFARAQAQAIHKSIATMGELDDVAQAKAEMNETSQTFARVSIYADTRIGEILRELPTRQGKRTDLTSVTTVTKVEAEKQAGISHKTAVDLQALAANPDVVEAVIARAESEGKVPSRLQVTNEIKRIKAEKEQAERARRQAEAEKARAERERDEAHEALEDAYHANELLENENVRLRNQPKPAPEIVEHEVIKEVVRKVAPDDYDELKRRVGDLKHEKDIYLDTNKELRSQLESTRKELEQAKDILGMDKSIQDVRRDVQYLISATNSYVRRYGGLTWTVDRLGELDDDMREQFRKAILNLATFSNALMESM